MSITTLYHVSVDIPNNVYEKFGYSLAYQHAVSNAIKGFIDAGSNAYGDVEEWATFDSMKDAQACEKALLAVVESLKAQLKDQS